MTHPEVLQKVYATARSAVSLPLSKLKDSAPSGRTACSPL
jgi:hypothetical protein